MLDEHKCQFGFYTPNKCVLYAFLQSDHYLIRAMLRKFIQKDKRNTFFLHKPTQKKSSRD